MNEKHISFFTESSIDVIQQVTGLKPIPGKVLDNIVPNQDGNIVVVIGLTGNIHGNTVISFNSNIACKVASQMMGGMPVPELDDIAKSAISELCNMIMGNTASAFSRNGINMEITPPIVFMGDKIQYTQSNSIVTYMPFNFEDETLGEITISFIQNEQV